MGTVHFINQSLKKCEVIAIPLFEIQYIDPKTLKNVKVNLPFYGNSETTALSEAMSFTNVMSGERGGPTVIKQIEDDSVALHML